MIKTDGSVFTCNFCKRSEPQIFKKCRGLCRGCYGAAQRLIMHKKTSWEELEAAGITTSEVSLDMLKAVEEFRAQKEFPDFVG